MKKIDSYLLKEMFLPVVFGVTLFTFVLMIDIINAISEILVVKSVPIIEVLTMFSYLSPQILVQTVPMGIFFGIMITYNSMSSNSELVALQASGMSLNRIMRIPVFIGIITTICVYAFQEKIQPIAQKRADMLIKKISYSKPASQLESKRFVSDVGGLNLYIDEIENNVAKNLIIFNKAEGSTFPQIILAKKTEFTNSEIIVLDAKLYDILVKTSGDQSITQAELVEGDIKKQVRPVSSFFGDFRQSSITKESLGIIDLIKDIKNKKANGEFSQLLEVELYKKIYIPLSGIILAALAPLLSIRHARTIKGLSLGISLAVIFAYMGSLNTILAFAEKGQINATFGLFIPNLVLIIITIIAYIRQNRR